MKNLILLACSLLCALLLVLSLAAPRAAVGASPRTLWTRPAGATAYAAPRPDAGALASIPENQPVRVSIVDTRTGWARILLWNALPAYVPLASLQDQPTPYTPHPPPPPLQLPYAGAHLPMP